MHGTILLLDRCFLNEAVEAAFLGSSCPLTKNERHELRAEVGRLILDDSMRHDYYKLVTECLAEKGLEAAIVDETLLPDPCDIYQSGFAELSVQQLIAFVASPGIINELAGTLPERAADEQWWQDHLSLHSDLFLF